MRPIIIAVLASGLTLMQAEKAIASEEQFLTSLEGKYEGKGQVMLRTDRGPITVTCSFRSTATKTTLSLNGKCRGLVVISRSIGAKLARQGNSYKGSYVGAGSGPATHSGKRNGNSLNLTIRWAKEINGDRSATLSVAKSGPQGLNLTTTDRDPATGKAVVTSKIVLNRV
jgi:hypothetical protein